MKACRVAGRLAAGAAKQTCSCVCLRSNESEVVLPANTVLGTTRNLCGRHLTSGTCGVVCSQQTRQGQEGRHAVAHTCRALEQD